MLAQHLLPQAVAGGHADHHRARLDQGDRPVLELAGRVALGPQVGDLLQLRARPPGPPGSPTWRPRKKKSRAPARRSATSSTSLARSSDLVDRRRAARPCCRSIGVAGRRRQGPPGLGQRRGPGARGPRSGSGGSWWRPPRSRARPGCRARRRPPGPSTSRPRWRRPGPWSRPRRASRRPCEGVDRLAGLADADGQRPVVEHRVAVAELAGDVDLGGEAGPLLDGVLGHHGRRGSCYRRPRCRPARRRGGRRR